MRLCFVVTLFLLSFQVSAFTPGETNQVVRSLLGRVRSFAEDDDWSDEPKVLLPEQDVETWETFIGGTHVIGWSFDDKKGAFDWYLSTLGTRDCRGFTFGQKWDVLAAISQCQTLNYTNAIPYLRNLAFNPNGVHRETAIETAIQLGEVDDGMTTFVESIVTNLVVFSVTDRVTAYSEYARKVIAKTNDCSLARMNAGRMFYRNRFIGNVGKISVDWAVKACFPLYELSSNRFQTAMRTLSQENCAPHVRDYFITVTNQLLSSGQPLRWITVGGNE